MRQFILFALISITLSSHVINKNFVEQLKKIAPFDVYEPEENPFRDWTREEIRNMLGTKRRYFEQKEQKKITINGDYDFRKVHPECVSEVREQGECAGDWAFSAVTVLQQRWCQKSKGEQKPILAPQDPISCNKENEACLGGYIDFVWDYLYMVGVVEESCFPYTAMHGHLEKCENTCVDESQRFRKYLAGYKSFLGDPETIMSSLPKNGPVSATMTVYSDFMNYKGGIYQHVSGEQQGNQAVVIIGYGSEDGVNYWICQNSWGPNWGESGYFRIKFYECGIDSECYAALPDKIKG